MVARSILCAALCAGVAFVARAEDPIGTRASAEVRAAMDDCCAQFCEQTRLREPCTTICGPKRIPDLDDVQYGNGDDLDDSVHSVRTGNAASVQLWDDDEYEGNSIRIPPGSEHDDADGAEAWSSLAISCQNPL